MVTEREKGTSRRALALPAIALLTLLAIGSGCAGLPSPFGPQEPAPTSAATRTTPPGSPTALAKPAPTGAPVDGQPGRPSTATVAIDDGEANLFVHLDQGWSVRRPPVLSKVETVDGTVVFASDDGTRFAAVDVYQAARDEHQDSGEGLRSRAADVLQRLLSRGGATVSLRTTPLADDRGDLWDVGLTFTTNQGVRGAAFYRQPGRHQGDFRVEGFLYGYTGSAEPADLRAMRDSLKAVHALQLDARHDGRTLVALHSQGFRGPSQDPSSHHFVALAARDDGGWRALSLARLECPDFLGPDAVAPARVDEQRLWLEVRGGAGAHGGCYDLLRFDGQTLHVTASANHSGPDVARLQDLNGDGTPELVVNQTDDYVFCYACNVRLIQYRVLRWDGARWTDVQLAPLPESTPAEVRQPGNRAVELARAGLWKDALPAAEQALARGRSDETAAWNAALIRLHAEARAEHARNSGYPLLTTVFYGDYDAALEFFRPYQPSQIFTPRTPLVVGTPADQGPGRETLTKQIVLATTLALQVKPDLAAAYFLRGWAISLSAPGDPGALANVQRAAELNPAESLYERSVAYLKEVPPAPPPSAERISFVPGSTSHTATVELRRGEPKALVLNVMGGQRMTVSADGGVRIAVFDAEQRLVAPESTGPGRWEGTVPGTGDYLVVIEGEGRAEVTITIPPRG
ncbi:MAG TPA: hypothetical protein VIN09_11530 [Chloroflexota bacterium]